MINTNFNTNASRFNAIQIKLRNQDNSNKIDSETRKSILYRDYISVMLNGVSGRFSWPKYTGKFGESIAQTKPMLSTIDLDWSLKDGFWMTTGRGKSTDIECDVLLKIYTCVWPYVPSKYFMQNKPTLHIEVDFSKPWNKPSAYTLTWYGMRKLKAELNKSAIAKEELRLTAGRGVTSGLLR